MFMEERENILGAGLIEQREFEAAIDAMIESVRGNDSMYIGLIFVASAIK